MVAQLDSSYAGPNNTFEGASHVKCWITSFSNNPREFQVLHQSKERPKLVNARCVIILDTSI